MTVNGGQVINHWEITKYGKNVFCLIIYICKPRGNFFFVFPLISFNLKKKYGKCQAFIKVEGIV